MLLERYEIGELVAESERNTVRRVKRLRDGARLVIKTSTREYPSVRELRRLEFEHQLLCKVRSPGVIAVVDLERQSGRVALVLEDFGGERLSSRTGKALALTEFFPIARGIAAALGHVHSCDVIHKDINPSNVLLNTSTREIKLIDFSLASELSRERLAASPHTALEGTLPYISPEQTGRMNRELDYRTDYYSLGVTFFELLAGALPFRAPDVLGYIHCHLSKPAPSARDVNPAVPEGLARLVNKLMAKSPEERYQSARGLLADLAHCERVYAEQGDVPSFELGRADVSERFQVSQALLGREAEAARLLAAFERAARGRAGLLLVSGYSGIGKSTLVSEIHKPLVEKRANYCAGKFEQLDRNTPYGAWLAALRGFLKQVLSEPEQKLQERRASLEAALGSEAAVLTALLPELSQIMGPQPAVADLSAREAQGRLLRLFRAFLGAVASAEQPLAIFLDDLQWCDGSTPQLLLQLFAERELKHVFVIGAYRDNEVSDGHLLQAALVELRRKRAEALEELALAPLSEHSVLRIVASTLHAAEEHCAALGSLVFQKTGGNPFFVHELLHQLYRESAIEFSAAEGRWLWHAEQAARAAVSDNVVELMLRRLKLLGSETLECLRIAACLGNEFELGLVARISKKTPGAVSALLWEAVEQRLLSPQGDAYRLLRRDRSDHGADIADTAIYYEFPHDRVVEAAYSLLGASERAVLHAHIGRVLKTALPEAERAARVFDYIDHQNLGRELLESLEERRELAGSNYVAAERARRSAAYASAIAYLDTALGLLSDAEWQADAARRFACARMRVECTFLSGRVDEARAACDALFERAPGPVERVAAYCLKAAILEQQSLLGEAVATILQGLRELGVELPSEPAAIEQGIGAGIGKMLGHLERVPIEGLSKLPAATDPLRVAITELLFQIIPAASQINPPLFILAELVLFDEALTHGIVPGSAKNVMDCGIVFSAILKDYARAYRMGKAAFELLDQSSPTPLESAVNFVFGCFTSHWGAHFQEGLDALARGHQRGVELGDVLHASYSIVHRAKSLFFAGKELGECRAQTERAAAYALATGAVGHVALPRILTRALGQLTGDCAEHPDVSASDAEFISEIEKTQNGHFLFVLGQTQTVAQFVLGDFARAVEWDAFAHKYSGVGNAAFTVPDYHLFAGLILARKWREGPLEERAAIQQQIEEHQATLNIFAAASPKNFNHKQLLLGAELARLRAGSIDEVLHLHSEVLRAAGDDFAHIRALSYELLAEFWKERGRPEFARECLLEAYHLYRHWGARAKLARMDREHGKWLQPAAGNKATSLGSTTLVTATATASIEGSSLDIASVLKATLALSSEVKPERLFAVLMQTIIENAGAESGHLILAGAGQAELVVVAKASVIAAEARSGMSVPLDDCGEVAKDVVRFVARTYETLVLDDAHADGAYTNDAHIRANLAKSVLCMPILNQGRLLAILYAENNAVARAFTPGRLLFLRVLAGQAAVSIANAQLYDRLELKVRERTAELAERNREVSAMLNSLEQGIFTIDEELHIAARYSAHLPELLGTKEIAGQDCLELLFADSKLDAEALDKMRSSLQFCFGSPLVFAEANKSHWVREFQRTTGPTREPRSFEVDWTLIADSNDSVTRVLVAVRDVTVLKQISQKAAQHARELDFVGQILDAGVDHFQRFCASARELMLDAREWLEASADVDRETQRSIFRGLHTVKGNARLLGFNHLANTTHRAEESFDGDASVRPSRAQRTQMLAGVESVLAGIEEYERIYQRKLMDILREPERRGERLWSAIALRVNEVKSGGLAAADAVGAIEELLRRGGAVPLAQVIKHGMRVLPVLAQELGKLGPLVEAEDRGIWLTADFAQVVKDALVHVFQNSMDHGIEAPEERRRRQKPAQGKLSVRAVTGAGGTVLRIADDGRGLDLPALRAHPGNAGLSDAELAERVFGGGMSTAERVTSISGRGIGLDAVRSFVRDLGGDVSITFTAAAGEDGARPFEIVIQLPQEAALGETQRPSFPPLAAEARPNQRNQAHGK